MNETQKYYGKYRGTVINNIDPEQRGRIQAIVPAVSNVAPTSWAMPCLPIAGKLEGFFAIPQIGAGVWIEFEEGDSDKPIWVGGFWGLVAEVPRRCRAQLAGSPRNYCSATRSKSKTCKPIIEELSLCKRNLASRWM